MRGFLTNIGRGQSRQRHNGNSRQVEGCVSEKLILLVCLLAAAAILPAHAVAAAPITTSAIPTANAYKRTLIREAQYVWGISAPTATFAAQLHQESGWNPDAISRVGARGMSQFMPKTASWALEMWPELAENQTYSPDWAIRALIRYDKWLWDNTMNTTTNCDRMALALRAYNGGETRLNKERAMCAENAYWTDCDPSRAWSGLERHNAGRSVSNHRENTQYPRRILLQHEPAYIKAGWGSGSCS